MSTRRFRCLFHWMLRQQLEHDSASTELCKVACPPFFDGFSPFSTVFPIALTRDSFGKSRSEPFFPLPCAVNKRRKRRAAREAQHHDCHVLRLTGSFRRSAPDHHLD